MPSLSNRIEIEGRCPHCRAWNAWEDDLGRKCAQCNQTLLEHPTDAFCESRTLDQCPLCGCAHLYKQKDFNRALGIALIAVGVILAFFTYGISLLIVTVIDWFLYRNVGEVGVCYLCESGFRKSPSIEKLEPFNLVLHDHYRAMRPLAG